MRDLYALRARICTIRPRLAESFGHPIAASSWPTFTICLATTPWQLVVAGNAVAEGLTEDGLARLRHVTNAIGNARASRASQSLRDTVESLWLELGGPHCLDNTAQLADARDYLSVLSAHEFAGKLRDELHFESALQNLFAAPDPSGDPRSSYDDSQSKGLEFDSVILPGLHKTAFKLEAVSHH